MGFFNPKIVTLFLILAPALSFAQGGSVGGGSDTHPDLNAWFTSPDLNKSVNICIESAPDFGFTANQLKQMTSTAFTQWSTYYQKSGGLLRNADQNRWKKCTINGEERKGYRIATHAIFLDRCDGSQDLTVYFGVENELTRTRKAKYFDPFAMAELESELNIALLQPAWSKGFIWIAPPKSVDPRFQVPLWTNYDGAALEFTLLHEMGHVFGTDHINGTVMRENLSQLLNEYTQVAVRNRTRADFRGSLDIDQNRFLSFVPEQEQNLRLKPLVETCSPDDESCIERNRPKYQFVYERLTGYQLRDAIFEARFSKQGQKVKSWDESAAILTTVLPSTLTITADGVTQNFTFEPISSQSENLQSTFREGCRQFPHKQIDVFGILKNDAGVSRFMSLKINWGKTKISLVDPTLPSTDPYCQWQSQNQDACVLLSIDMGK